jgi:hypothetical protein
MNIPPEIKTRFDGKGEIGNIFKLRAQAVSKAGIKIEGMIKEYRKIRSPVKNLISILHGPYSPSC